MKKSIFIVFIVFLIQPESQAQEAGQSRIWFGNYTSVKLDKRWFVDNYLLTSIGAKDNKFSFVQNDLALNYRLSRVQSIYAGYSNIQLRNLRVYEQRYDNEVTSFNTLSFNRVFVGYKHLNKLSRILRLKHDIGAQFYFPSFQKFKYRFTYRSKLYLRNRKWPLELSPFTQFSLYYYQGGNPIVGELEGEEGEEGEDGDLDSLATEVVRFQAPNGFHRYRIKAGISFKPIESIPNLGVVLYYAFNKEFNINGLGNNLHVLDPEEGRTHYRFNNYAIYGIQINLIF